MSAAELRNKGGVAHRHVGRSGQALKTKGTKTRRRLMDATAQLLEEKPLRELKVADISRLASTSTSAFYLYFEDVPDVVLALVADVTQGAFDLLPLELDAWHGAAAFERALTFTRAYSEFWGAHKALLRARNLAAEEGDIRFVQVRRMAMRPLLDRFAERISGRQKNGQMSPDLQPMSIAAALITLLERVSAIGPLRSEEAGVTREEMISATAHIFATTLAN